MKKIIHSKWIEIMIIAAGAIVYCLPILNFSSMDILGGGEFISLIQTHFIWKVLPQCGDCVFWNGLFNGGAPTFAEVHNAPAHPFVILPTILLGAINGSKITFVISIFTAGIGQWRLSRGLGLGKIIRIWTAYMMMFAGGLTGKMALGNVGLVLSASCSVLFFSELYYFIFRPLTKTTYLKIGIFFSLCVLAGQGYYQFALLVLWIPLSLVFAYKTHGIKSIVVFVKGLALSFLLCGYFLLPMLHFIGNFTKEADPSLLNLQPVKYSVLNLVIKDATFFWKELLGKQNLTYTYYQYIGYIPIIFAVYTVTRLLRFNKENYPIIWLILSGFIVFFFVSDEIMLPLSTVIKSLQKLRYAAIIVTLVIPPILGLAGIGFSGYIKQSPHHSPWHTLALKEKSKISFKILLSIILMCFSVYDNFENNRKFLYTLEFNVPPKNIREQLLSDEVKWVYPINSFYFPYMIINDVKLSPIFRPWHWKGHPDPQPAIKAVHHPDERDAEATFRIEEMDFYVDENQVYAGIYDETDALIMACDAVTAGGGTIDATCLDVKGENNQLIVQENYYEGWHAWIDGERVDLDTRSNFIRIVDFPSGKHEIALRYQPWDVWAGIGFSFLGIFICYWDSKKEGLRNHGLITEEEKI